MARRPQVSYYDSRGAYYTQIRGQKKWLADGPDDRPDGPNYKAAFAAFWKLLEDDSIHIAGDTNNVRVLCDAYLTAKMKEWKPDTYEMRQRLLCPFVDMFGKVAASHVTKETLDKVVERMSAPRMLRGRPVSWSSSTAGMFRRVVKAVFRWAAEEELITRSPLRKMKLRKLRTRARERVIASEEHTAVLDALQLRRSQPLRRLIIALENTGARPGELRNARVRDWNDALGAIVYFGDDKRREDEFAHKTSADDKDRVIYFTGDALAMVRAMVAGKKPMELIFPTGKGQCYSKQSLDVCFRQVRERVGLPHLVPYSYRHTFATRWLEAKKSIEMLAEILGNTVRTIREHYSHLCKSHDVLRAELEEFRRSGVG